MSEMGNLLQYGQLVKKLYGNLLREVTDRYGMTRNEVDVLLFLANNPSYDTEKDIVQLRALSKSQVCKSVDALMRRGYLDGAQDERDRRCLHLRLLPASGKAVAEARKAQKKFLERLYRGVTDEEKEMLRKLSRKMLKNLKEAL